MKPILIFALTAVLTIPLSSCRKSEFQLKTLNLSCKPNKGIQRILEEEVNARRKINNPDWACALVLNGRGEIIAGYETYDSTKSHIHLYDEQTIGSLFMPFPVLMATKTHLVDSNSVFAVHKEGWLTNDSTVFIIDGHPRDTTFRIRDVLASSSYEGVGRIMAKVLLNNKHYEKWYKDNLWELDCTSNLSSDRNEYLVITGSDVITTPIHLTWLYHCLVHGLFPKKWHVESSGVLKGLHDCVWNNDLGTASVSMYGDDIVYDRAQSDKVAIMGKTGSVMIDNNPHKHIISFVGIFPEDNPKYTCLVMFGNPKGIYCAGVDCGGTVRRIAERIMTKSNK